MLLDPVCDVPELRLKLPILMEDTAKMDQLLEVTVRSNTETNNNFRFYVLLTVHPCTNNGTPPEPYRKQTQNDHIQHKNKINGNLGEPHTGW